MSAGLIDKLLDVVVATDLDHPMTTSLRPRSLCLRSPSASYPRPSNSRMRSALIEIAGDIRIAGDEVVSAELKAFRRLHGLR
jgi:hypothetical protein